MLSVFKCVLEKYHPMFMKIEHRGRGDNTRYKNHGTSIVSFIIQVIYAKVIVE
jgi:hypothetical protein